MVHSGDIYRDTFSFFYPVIVFFGFFVVALVGEIAALFFGKLPREKILLAVAAAAAFLYGYGYLLARIPSMSAVTVEGVLILVGSFGVVMFLAVMNVVFAVKSIQE